MLLFGGCLFLVVVVVVVIVVVNYVKNFLTSGSRYDKINDHDVEVQHCSHWNKHKYKVVFAYFIF